MDSVINSENSTAEGCQPEIGFFEISKDKLLIMSLGTFGLYGLYWMHQNWSRYNQREGASTWPIARAIFSIFFIHSLFSHIEAHYRRQSEPLPYALGRYATLYVLTALLSLIPSPSNPAMEGIVSALIAMISTASISFVLVKAQQIVNLANGDAQGATNHTLTAANFAWLTVGIVLWALTLFGLLMAIKVL